MHVDIREATSADAPDLASLLGQLGYPTGESDVRTRLAQLASPGTDYCIVASKENEVVGMAALHLSLTLVDDQPVAKLAALVVDERHRGQGIGEALVAAAEQQARSQGCSLIFLTSGAQRDGAHSFYRRIGFTETGLRFAKTL